MITAQDEPSVIPPQFRDPRESALGLQFSAALGGACLLTSDLLMAGGLAHRTAAPGLLGWLFVVISYIVGTVWLRRCWTNAGLLADEPLPFSLRWATAGWLVPVVSIWMRWRILLALRRAGRVPGLPVAVHLWGTLELIAFVATIVHVGHPVPVWAVLALDALAVVRLVAFLVTVRQITRSHAEAPKPVAVAV